MLRFYSPTISGTINMAKMYVFQASPRFLMQSAFVSIKLRKIGYSGVGKVYMGPNGDEGQSLEYPC